MDRIVLLIVLAVVTNAVLEITGVRAQTKDSRSYAGSVGAQYQLPNRAANDVELVDPVKAAPSDATARSARNQLFDNIFKVCFFFFVSFFFLNSWAFHVIFFFRFQYQHCKQLTIFFKALADHLVVQVAD